MEEAIRFTKQGYDLEDIRVLTCDRLRNLIALVNAVELGARIKLDILASHLNKDLQASLRRHRYAIADGISRVCARAPRRPIPLKPPDQQLALRLL